MGNYCSFSCSNINSRSPSFKQKQLLYVEEKLGISTKYFIKLKRRADKTQNIDAQFEMGNTLLMFCTKSLSQSNNDYDIIETVDFLQEGLIYLKTSASAGNTSAALRLGDIFNTGFSYLETIHSKFKLIDLSHLIQIDNEEAFKWYKIGSQYGSKSCQNNIMRPNLTENETKLLQIQLEYIEDKVQKQCIIKS